MERYFKIIEIEEDEFERKTNNKEKMVFEETVAMNVDGTVYVRTDDYYEECIAIELSLLE